MTTKLMVQLALTSPTERGYRKLTTFVPYDPAVQPGVVITLKDSGEPERQWTVEHVGQPHIASDIKRGWNNNI